MLLALVIFLGAGFGGSFVGGVIYGQTLQDGDSELSPRLGATSQFQGGGQGAAGGQRGQGRQSQQGQGGGLAGPQGGGGQSEARQPGGSGNSDTGQGRQRGPGGAVERPVEGADGVGQGLPTSQQSEGNQDGQRPDRSNPVGQSETPAGETETQPAVDVENAPQATSAAGSGEGTASPRGSSGRGGVVGTVRGLEAELLTVTTPRGELAVTLSDSTTVFRVVEASREDLASQARVRVAGSRDPEGSLLAQSIVIVPEGREALFGGGGPSGRQRGQAP